MPKYLGFLARDLRQRFTLFSRLNDDYETMMLCDNAQQQTVAQALTSLNELKDKLVKKPVFTIIQSFIGTKNAD